MTRDTIRVRRLDQRPWRSGVARLVGTPEKIWFSPDDSLVAAISQGWEIGVWDRRTGALKLILDAPQAPLPITPPWRSVADNRRLAFSSDVGARLWDLETGEVMRRWALPKGLLDAMVFQGRRSLDSGPG